jgi:O-antigen ligase
MATIAALPFVPMRWRAALILIAAIGIAPTFSRFGIIFMAILIVVAILMKLLDRRQVLILLASVPVLLAGAEIYYELIVQSGNQNVLGRLAWFESMGRIGDFSTRERRWVAELAWQQFQDNPILGDGLGATVSRGQRAGTHNMYLLLMAEQGLVGLALYLSLIGLFFVRGRRLVRRALDATDRDIGRAMVLYALFLALYGVTSHNVLEEPHGVFMIAFLAAAGFEAMRRARQATAEPAP